MNRRSFARTLFSGAAMLTAAAAWPGCARWEGSRKGRAATAGTGAVLNGIDVLARENFAALAGLRLGLITNHTGHDRQRRPTIDLLKNAPGVNLVTLFGPEHGIRGEADEKIGDSVDRKTGLQVNSLYGERRKPTREQLRGLDALVFDIQDIGCRFYTYPSTMGLCLEAAAQAQIKFIVLDRVNPINGLAVEGPLHTGPSSFVAFYPVPLRHGLTVGELAQRYNRQKNFGANLTVIRCDGWRRSMWFEETGLPWTNPSPNMRSVAGAILYPGIGLHETALCVGRGTDKPFELIAAPYIDDVKLAAELRTARLPGLEYVPIRVTPTYSTFKDKPCAGVAFSITDREAVNAVDLGLTVALTLQRLYPGEFALNKLNTLLQHPATIDAIKAGQSLQAIKQRWAAELAAFSRSRQSFLLYA